MAVRGWVRVSARWGVRVRAAVAAVVVVLTGALALAAVRGRCCREQSG